MAKIPSVLRRLLVATLLLPALISLPLASAQTAPPQPGAQKENKPAPAPKHDLTGTWDPGDTGIGQLGARAMPEDGNPVHRPPYTPAGLEALNAAKPSNGIRAVLPAETNDPVVTCDPQGMPREDLYEMRATQILQTPEKTFILYTFGKVWRVVWTDGRELPKDPEPRWYGYSIGRSEEHTSELQS